MAQASCDLVVPDDLKLEQLRTRLAVNLNISEGSSRDSNYTYWDSFDWRVYAAGGLLIQETGGVGKSVAGKSSPGRGSSRLYWQDRETGEERGREALDAPPGLIAGLPIGPLRKTLEPVLEMRTLLPLVTVHSRVTLLNLLNEDAKTVARLRFTDSRFSVPDCDLVGPLGKRLCLLPVRGYADEFEQLSAALDQDLGLAYASGHQFEEVLAAAGRTPGDYSSKLAYHLDPTQRADAATKEIMRGLLATLEANIDGTRANLDSEFLHDLRVACRRTRSALTQIKGVFPQEIVENYKQRFAWLQQATGPVRDLDVYLLEFDDHQRALPQPMRASMEPMREFLASHYNEEQRAMVRKLKSPQFRKLLSEWRRFIEAPVPVNPGAANAGLPARQLADQRIWKMYRRVRN